MVDLTSLVQMTEVLLPNGLIISSAPSKYCNIVEETLRRPAYMMSVLVSTSSKFEIPKFELCTKLNFPRGFLS